MRSGRGLELTSQRIPDSIGAGASPFGKNLLFEEETHARQEDGEKESGKSGE